MNMTEGKASVETSRGLDVMNRDVADDGGRRARYCARGSRSVSLAVRLFCVAWLVACGSSDDATSGPQPDGGADVADASLDGSTPAADGAAGSSGTSGDGAAGESGTPGDGATESDGSCVEKTCGDLGASCGIVSTTCGEVDCGECAPPKTCGGGGVTNQCGCKAYSCTELGAECGTLDNGCEDFDCGGCTPPNTCGGGGVANHCGCACTLPNAATTCFAGVCSIDSCDNGWGNCDSDPTNGCEMDVRADLQNCGACAHACSFANGVASCAWGQCVLGTCNADYADCDNNPVSGCETNLNADPDNCNTCGNSCPSLGGTAICVNGVCDVSNCNPGLRDCDPIVAGCETDVTTSANHCAYCNNPCTFTNATAKCVASTCQIDKCNAGWGDCDANESNGCETNTDASVLNCGSCGNACPTRPQAQSTCANGACGFSCSSGWENCDGSAANGCEINLDADVLHCGTCTKNCTNPMPAHATTVGCASGSCTVVTCAVGYENTNGVFSDGCETQI